MTDFPDLPAFCRIPQQQRRKAWSDKQYARDMLRAVSEGQKAATQELNMKTNAKKTSKTDQVADLRKRRAATKGPAAPAGASAGKKAAKAKARTPAAPKAPAGAAKAVRPGSKLAIVVGLLKRKEGCTTAEILKACDWPAVSVPQMARSAGLTLRQEKDGKVTRYWGS